MLSQTISIDFVRHFVDLIVESMNLWVTRYTFFQFVTGECSSQKAT